MEIELQQLRDVVNRLFDHIITTRGVGKVELGPNFYWNVPEDELYKMENKPAKLDVGSLEDDWEFVSGLLKKDSDPVAYQLTEAAPLLRRLGEVLGKQLAEKGG